MKIAKVKINNWDAPQLYKLQDVSAAKGNYAIVKDLDVEDIGLIMDVFLSEKIDEKILKEIGDKEVLRKVSEDDIVNIKSNENEKKEFLAYCKNCVENLGLKMKIVDAHYSFDRAKIVFAFTAEGRVDFRELVKMLNRQFKKSIRMQQIGIRDEAKIVGKLGMCGRRLCCKNFLKELASVNSEAAEIQQIAHRGAERLSGICGRLMCCLNYEKETYKSLSKNLPELDTTVKYEGKEYKVIGRNILKQTLNLKIDKETTIEVPAGDVK